MEESTEQEWKGYEKNFLHEVDNLYDYTHELDVAMFPVDPRLGREYMRGPEQFVKRIKQIFCTDAFRARLWESKCFPCFGRNPWNTFYRNKVSRTDYKNLKKYESKRKI